MRHLSPEPNSPHSTVPRDWPQDPRLRLEPTACYSVLRRREASDPTLLPFPPTPATKSDKNRNSSTRQNRSDNSSSHERCVTFAKDANVREDKRSTSSTNIAESAKGEAEKVVALMGMVAMHEGVGGGRGGGGQGVGDKEALSSSSSSLSGVVCIEVVCTYTRSLVAQGFARRCPAWKVTADK